MNAIYFVRSSLTQRLRVAAVPFSALGWAASPSSQSALPLSAGDPLRARRFRCRLCGRLRLSSATISKIRIPLLACRHDLRVDLRQGLRGLLPLRRPEHNRPNTIYCHPKTHLGTVVSKARPCTCRRDQGAGVPGHSLSGRGVSGRKLSRLCQHNDQTK